MAFDLDRFRRFFASDFDRLLMAVEIPDMADASWDRKAAYLLWLATDDGRNLPKVPERARRRDEDLI